MSLYYTHLLVPSSPRYCPGSQVIAEFMRRIISRGHVDRHATIEFAAVSQGKSRTFRMPNPATGEMIEIPGPTRTAEPPQAVSDPAEIPACAAECSEFNVWVSGQGNPEVPPLVVGYVEDDQWTPMTDPYHHEVRCCVRNHVVRLSFLDREEELDFGSVDLTRWRPSFNEDCSEEERDGLFAHPEIGTIRIPHAGCGMFWIEFNLGKFLFPRAEDGGVDVVAEAVLRLAEEVFATEFVQASRWG